MNKYNKQLLVILNVKSSNQSRRIFIDLFFFALVLSVIYEQLIKSQHSLLIGNASLLFGHIINHSSACIFLKKTPGIEKTISQMLKLVEQSWLSKPAKKNVAIFITKLVKADERYVNKNASIYNIYILLLFSFLLEFRQQHGTEILHSALKDVEL